MAGAVAAGVSWPVADDVCLEECFEMIALICFMGGKFLVDLIALVDVAVDGSRTRSTL